MKKEMPMRICLCVAVLFFSVVISTVDALAAPVPDTEGFQGHDIYLDRDL